MSWQTEWKAISDRIEGLLEAGRFFVQLWVSQSSDSYGTAKKELLPQARLIFQDIISFKKTYEKSLPPTAINSIDRFIQRHFDKFHDRGIAGIAGLKSLFPCLASFRSEFTFQLSDIQAVAKRITDRAFVHLQRLIIADKTTQQRWFEAFKSGETACEKLGAAHLLLHGVWAFKAPAEGERSDLILGEPLRDLFQVEATSDALVLTEWKVVRSPAEVIAQAEQAFRQASIYAGSSLAGFELKAYRYLVLVSKDRVNLPDNRSQDGIAYHYINIPVKPNVPSRLKT